MNKKIRMVGLLLVSGFLLCPGFWQQKSKAAEQAGEGLELGFSPATTTTSFVPATRPATAELASTITVTSVNDGTANAANCPGPNCRLRDAIAKAAAGDTINFSVTGTITLSNSDLVINKNLTINGPGAALLTLKQTTLGSVFSIPLNTVTFTVNNLTLTGGSANQGAGIENFGTTTLSNSIVTSNSAQFGGAIYNSGTMTISNSNIHHNSATSGIKQGGGIKNVGDMTISSSTFSDNNALGGDGAGIYNTGNLNISSSTFSDSRSNYGGGISTDIGTVTITDTTFRNNNGDKAGGAIYIESGVLNLSRSTLVGNMGGITNFVTPGHGGGIYNKGTASLTSCTLSANSATGNSGGIGNFGTLTLINSTLSGNSSALQGGGISSSTSATLTLINSTISGNSAPDGGGINTDGTVNARNTLIAGNTGQVHGPDVNGSCTSQGYNLIGNNSGTTITPMTGDLIGTATAPINPLLAPLGDYGGPTQTHALAANSPAINAGNNCVTQTPGCLSMPLTTDQRGSGFNRLVGSAVDIGAFEQAGNDTAPMFTAAAPLSRQSGSPAGAAVTIGTVSDVPTPAGNLIVTQIAGGSATGITVTDIINTNGTITAMVSASCTATAGTIRFQVSDGLFTNTGDLTVNVSANTSPVLTYATVSVSAGGSTTNSPTAATDNGSITSYVLQSQGLYTGTISVNSSSGVVSISNAAPVGNHTIIIRAIDNCGATTDANFRLAVNSPNTAPTFTPAAAISRQQGSPAGTMVTVGTVSDTQTAAGSLTVTQIAGGTATGITVNGITNTNGTITASVSASCSATAGTVRFQVSDGSLTGTGDLQVTITANTAPTLTYNNISVNAGASTTNSPASVIDNGSITGYAVQSPGTYTGTISVNASGVVSFSNAAPAGNHTITIRATDNCGATRDATFTLTVNTPNTAPTFTPAAAISCQQGSPAGAAVTVGIVSDSQTAPGSLTVTQIAGGTATGIIVTSIANTSGTITAIVSASCTAVAGTVRFQVSDGSLTGTGDLQINVMANSVPTLTYGAVSTTTGGSTSNSPTTATDNGSISSYTVQSQGTYTGTISVNSSGVVSISNAAPAGSHTITIRATDNCGATTNAQFTLTVNACAATLSKTAQNFAANGGAGNFTVTIGGACQWTAVSNDPGFITIVSPTGQQTGSGTVTLSIASHTSTTPRSGTITVAGQTFSVRQGAQFLDVPVGAAFYEEIGKVSAVGITLGCGDGNYCPGSNVSRDQMAAFIIRGLHAPGYVPPPPATQRFLDVPSNNPFYAFIEEMAVRQITLGCGDGNYCPATSVTRDQMAAFIIRGLHEPGYVPPPPATQRFLDVPSGNPFYAYIEEMAVRQITLGCGGGNYCPATNVTRDQMAAFLVRAFGL